MSEVYYGYAAHYSHFVNYYLTKIFCVRVLLLVTQAWLRISLRRHASDSDDIWMPANLA